MFSDELKAFRRLGFRHVSVQESEQRSSVADTAPALGSVTGAKFCKRNCFGPYALERHELGHQLRVTHCRRTEVRFSSDSHITQFLRYTS